MSEAAERLGVSTRQVQHLVAQGELRQLARGIVDETSVERLLAVRGETQRSRLKGRHRRLGAAEWSSEPVSVLTCFVVARTPARGNIFGASSSM